MRKFHVTDLKRTTSVRRFKKEFKKLVAKTAGENHWDKICGPDMSMLLLKEKG